VLTYGKPEALPIAQAAQDGAFYKVKYDSGSLIYVRKLGAEAAHGSLKADVLSRTCRT